jgi:tetratricopeptide (TPR) repeat protein
MRKQDFLIHLIKSLTPAERRYFKLSSGAEPGDKEYMKLYDALENCEQYDAKALSKQLGISTGALAEKKHYLSQALLQSLHNIDAYGPDNTIARLERDVIALINRRMFDYALELIDKTLALAYERERFQVVCRLLQHKIICQQSLQVADGTEQLPEEYKRASDAAAELFELLSLRVLAIVIENEKQGSDKLKKLIQKPVLDKKPEDLHSLSAQMEWFHIMFRYYFAEGDLEKVRQLTAQEVKHYELHPQIKVINPIVYVVSFSRLANAESESDHIESALEVMEKFKSALSDPSLAITPARIESLKYYASSYDAHLLHRLGRYDESLSLYEKCYTAVRSRPVPDQYSIIFEYGVVLFLKRKLTEAAAMFDELLGIKEDIRYDVQENARLLMILIQLDMRNYAVVPYLIKAVRAWRKQKKRTEPKATLFISHCYSIAMAPETKRRDAYLKLKEASVEGKLGFTDSHFNVKAWVELQLAR